MWRSCNEWSQADKDKWKKDAERINKAWGEKNERERRERVINALFDENKEKINNEVTTSKNQSSTSKNNNQSQKM